MEIERKSANSSSESHCLLLNPTGTRVRSAVKGINLGLGEIVRPTMEAVRVPYTY